MSDRGCPLCGEGIPSGDGVFAACGDVETWVCPGCSDDLRGRLTEQAEAT